MIDPMVMYSGKGPIPVWNRGLRVVEWWVVGPAGRRLGNPVTGQVKLLDDPANRVGDLEIRGYMQQGWVRFDVGNGYERDYAAVTERDVEELVRFVSGSIASSKRGMIFAMIREWRLYRKWWGDLEEREAERSEKGELVKVGC